MTRSKCTVCRPDEPEVISGCSGLRPCGIASQSLVGFRADHSTEIGAGCAFCSHITWKLLDIFVMFLLVRLLNWLKQEIRIKLRFSLKGKDWERLGEFKVKFFKLSMSDWLVLLLWISYTKFQMLPGIRMLKISTRSWYGGRGCVKKGMYLLCFMFLWAINMTIKGLVTGKSRVKQY